MIVWLSYNYGDPVRPSDPAYARFARFGGFKSAEARSAKAERRRQLIPDSSLSGTTDV